ncbi:MAG TPA: hybrid sensor histidine kinase/response regulator [Dongiaceae bacterium]|nr:hybrid sensor histidine kinase/response regulator [Dongiaceae bacterium]
MNAPSNPSTFRILIADDEPNMLNAYSSVLLADGTLRQADHVDELESELFGPRAELDGKQHYELVLCQQGQQAISAVKKAAEEGERFSVAFLDVRMPPGINGVETARQIRAIDPDLHIVFVTAYSDTDPRDIARMVPPVERLFYVAKPFQPLELQQFASALSTKWRAERELSDAYTTLKRQYTALESANAELARAREKAESASHTKTEFMANMTHELRTPLNAILGFSEIMIAERYGAIGNERYRSYVSDIHSSGSQLLGIVGDILDLSKIEIGEVALEEERIDIDELCDSALRQFADRAKAAGLALSAEMAPGLPALQGDPRRVKQVLTNLLSNAIKFNCKGGSVRLGARRASNGGLLITVADTGVGIDAAHIDKAMAPFSQVDGSLTRRYQGTGLGLPIARALIGLHGGRLSLDSVVGKGTTVTVSFPKSRVV